VDESRPLGGEGVAQGGVEAGEAVAARGLAIAAGQRHGGEIDMRRDRGLAAGRIVDAVVEQEMDEIARRIGADGGEGGELSCDLGGKAGGRWCPWGGTAFRADV